MAIETQRRTAQKNLFTIVDASRENEYTWPQELESRCEAVDLIQRFENYEAAYIHKAIAEGFYLD